MVADITSLGLRVWPLQSQCKNGFKTAAQLGQFATMVARQKRAGAEKFFWPVQAFSMILTAQ